MCSGVASIGARGQSAPLDSKIIVKNQEKKGGNWEKREEKSRKRGKIGKKRQKSGRFFHFAAPGK